MLEPEDVSQDETGSENDLRTAMNFVLVNHGTLRRPSCCAACSRPLQRSYLICPRVAGIAASSVIPVVQPAAWYDRSPKRIPSISLFC